MGRSHGSGHEERGGGGRARWKVITGDLTWKVWGNRGFRPDSPNPAYQTRHCITQEEQRDAREAVESNTRGKSEDKGRGGVPQRGRGEGVGTEGMGVRHRRRSGTRGKISFILSHTNQNMGPRRDVTPRSGRGRDCQPAQDEKERCRWTEWEDQEETKAKAPPPSRVQQYVNQRQGHQEESGKCCIGRGRKPWPRRWARRDPRRQGTVGVTLHGEEGDVGEG